jgi:hypothetical protein
MSLKNYWHVAAGDDEAQEKPLGRMLLGQPPVFRPRPVPMTFLVSTDQHYAQERRAAEDGKIYPDARSPQGTRGGELNTSSDQTEVGF